LSGHYSNNRNDDETLPKTFIKKKAPKANFDTNSIIFRNDENFQKLFLPNQKTYIGK
jgi:hypothetical protein